MRLISTIIFSIFLLSFAFAQKGTFRGNVFDEETGEPVPYCSVVIKNTNLGAITDNEGFFSISGIPFGSYEAEVSYIGYNSETIKIEINSSVNYQRIAIKENAETLQEVVVSGRKEAAKTEVQISKITITAKEIKALPSTGGEPDIAQYLQVLPGVISTGDQGGQLYIRGGSPVQNKVLLDGMTIYNPFHSIGFFSVFETEIIRSTDVYTGGFNAEYGDRISAIVDIKTREGNKKRFGGLVSASPFQAKALFEGPIIKLKEDSGTSVSFLLTGKHSYLDQTSKSLYKYAARDSTGLPFSFSDVYGKLSLLTGNGSKVNFFGFSFNDGVKYSSVADLNWNSTGGGANFLLVPGNSSLIIGGTVSYTNYDILLKEADDAPRKSNINGFNAVLDFTNFGNKSELKYGIELNGFRTDFQFKNPFGNTLSIVQNTTELAAFLKFRRTFGRIVFEPSVRTQYYASLGETTFEPRLGFKFNATDRLRFKFAGGYYTQNLISTVNERDIVNLFVGFLSGPEETFYSPDQTEEATSRLQKAYHAIGGVEIDFGKYTEVNIEPYFKRFSQLIDINRNKLKASDANYVTETGNAKGIDFSVRYNKKDLFIWATYSLGYVNRFDGEQTYPTNFDRRHNMNIVTTYDFGKDKLWQASARWNFGSGFPFTLTQGFYGNQTFDNGIGTDVNTNNPDLGVIYSDKRNSGRLPDYHRLDLALKRTFKFSKNSALDITASVTNAYDRANIFYFDRIRYERVNQLPILPALAMTFSF